MTRDSEAARARYQALLPLLVEGLERTLGARHGVGDYLRYCLRRFGRRIAPYLERFCADLAAGRVRVAGLGGATVPRAQVGEAERQALIARIAYFRSEARGFDGNSERDWAEAEAEVDAFLARGGDPDRFPD